MPALILTILALPLCALMFLDVGVEFEGGDGAPMSVDIRAGPLSLRILPRPEKKEKKKKTAPPPKTAPEKKPESPDAGRRFTPGRELIMALIPAALRAVRRFFGSLYFGVVVVHYRTGGDPAKAATRCGYCNALFGALEPLIASSGRTGWRELSASYDFTGDRDRLYVHFSVTVEVWALVGIGLSFVSEVLNKLYRER